ncbi:uncharacterized protein SCHCODRAFT_02514725 [Schizophyllum commune H4-8]|nr:uncharacterized protein SCHCODRAFT_02514725 [Schizophyllum commune H4-8]KAI5887578.1 hypothetical protein SCHCODRAFT_02514725 [Schizophyllum commune H4-8]
MPWLQKHNSVIDWNSLTIQLAPTLRAVVFEPQVRLRSVTLIKELPCDEADWIGEAPKDPRILLEETTTPKAEPAARDLAWDEPSSPHQQNSKQRKR